MSSFLKKTALLSAIVLICLFPFGCGNNSKDADIITTLYPQYDIARQIAGGKLSVRLLIPFGTEIHGYEPTAKEIVAANNAKLFIFTDLLLERWVEGLIAHDVNTLDLSKCFTLEPLSSPGYGAEDLHYWTDPTTILQLIDAILAEIIEADPENEAFYTENAREYYLEIEDLHLDAAAYFSKLQNPQIYFAGHNAMGAFGARYGISIRALSESFKPDADLTPKQLESIIEELTAAGSHFLFTEELTEPRAALTIKSQLEKRGHQLTLLELHGYHNISKHQNEQGVTYADLFRQNLINIKTALDD